MAKRIPMGRIKRHLSFLGLNTPYDVSRWCADHGVISKYVEMVVDEKLLYDSRPSWWVRDAKTPGVVEKRFGDILTRARSIHSAKKWSASGEASAWLSATYDMPIKFLPALNAFYSEIAVDQIMEDVQYLDTLYLQGELEFSTQSTEAAAIRTRYVSKTSNERILHGSTA